MALTYLGVDEHSTFDHINAHQSGENAGETAQSIILQSAQFDDVPVPNAEFLSRAVMTQDGQDLIMETPDGLTLIIEGYFSRPDTPDLVSPEGNKITPEMVKSFIQASATDYAQDDLAMNDASHVGEVGEVSGQAFVLRTDGSKVPAQTGIKIFQGDVIETLGDGAVNLSFIDESSFAVSSNARLAIDEYVFDPSSYEGTQNFSLLQGAFVYTSGLIGREDPDDVKIETPIGSIGIRGTIIAGNITATGVDSTVTVVEGAIVVTNATGEMTLDEQYETVQLDGMQAKMNMLGVLSPEVMSNTYNVMRPVAADLFSAVDDSANDANASDVDTIDAPEVEAAPEGSDNNTDGTEHMQDAPDDQSFLLLDDGLNFANLAKTLDQPDYMDTYLDDQISAQSGGDASFDSVGSLTQSGSSFTQHNQHESQDIASPVNINNGGGTQTQPANNTPVLSGVGEHGNEWTAVTGRQYAFDVAELFKDADGDSLTYSVQNVSLTNVSFANATLEPQFEGANPSTLIFTPTADATIGTVSFDIIATDSSGATSGAFNISFDVNDTGGFINVVSGSNYISSAGETLAFGDNVASTLTVSSMTSFGFQLFGGRFNDEINLAPSTNQTDIELYGGLGSDTFHDFGRGQQIQMVGGGGNDLMIVDKGITGRGLDALSSATTADYHISGGLGRDTLQIGGTASSLDFSIFSNKIDGIERIKTDNASAQTMTITANDVLQMTGGKELFVDGDVNDTVNLTGSGFTSTWQTRTVTENSGNEGSHNVTYSQWVNGDVSVYVNEATVA